MERYSVRTAYIHKTEFIDERFGGGLISWMHIGRKGLLRLTMRRSIGGMASEMFVSVYLN